jgi:hypothetical protein
MKEIQKIRQEKETKENGLKPHFFRELAWGQFPEWLSSSRQPEVKAEHDSIMIFRGEYN